MTHHLRLVKIDQTEESSGEMLQSEPSLKKGAQCPLWNPISLS